jgi:hypothetical protein
MHSDAAVNVTNSDGAGGAVVVVVGGVVVVVVIVGSVVVVAGSVVVEVDGAAVVAVVRYRAFSRPRPSPGSAGPGVGFVTPTTAGACRLGGGEDVVGVGSEHLDVLEDRQWRPGWAVAVEEVEQHQVAVRQQHRLGGAALAAQRELDDIADLHVGLRLGHDNHNRRRNGAIPALIAGGGDIGHVGEIGQATRYRRRRSAGVAPEGRRPYVQSGSLCRWWSSTRAIPSQTSASSAM